MLLAASDLHLYDDGSLALVREWADYVQEKKPADLILCGDIFDPWKSPWSTILSLESAAILQTLIRTRADAGLMTWYIRGNHDYGIKPQWVEGAEVVNKVVMGDTEFRHGWERDACHDEQTEVLTKNGWRHFKDIDDETEIATLKQGNTMEFQKPSRLYANWYDGPMFKTYSNQVDLLVTPNHNLYVRKRRWLDHSPFTFAKPHEIMGKRAKYKKAGVPCPAPETPSFTVPNENGWGIPVDGDTWAEFMGYYLSEGCAIDRRNTGRGFQVEVTQRPGWKRDVIRRCIQKMPFKFTENAPGFHCYNPQLGAYLSQFGHAPDKFIPADLKAMCPRQLKILLGALILGDGTNRKHGWVYYSTSKQLADDVQEIALKIGYGANISVKHQMWKKAPNGTANYDINVVNIFHLSAETEIDSKNKNCAAIEEWVDYHGMVYCAEVPNHVMLVRRGGKAVWCGNSWAIIHPFAYWIADHLPSVALRIHKMLYGEMPLSQYTVAPDPLSALEMCDRWNLHVGAIHTLWREYADRNKRRVVIGHTHCAWVDPLLCDCGSLAYGQWLEIEGDSIRVVTL